MGSAPQTALLFPGQGSQTTEMRELVARWSPDLLELALEEVGDDPFERANEGTRFAQPAIYCASLAAWTAAGRPTAACFAGHSLGEITALAAAGAIDEADGLRLTVRRGALMQEAAERLGDGGMLAVLGDPDIARELAARHELTVANDNAPTQLVLSGRGEALDACAAEARERKLRTVRLSVAGPFHSPAMADVVAPLRAALDKLEIRRPSAVVFSCIAASPFEHIREQLAEAIVRPVRWRETLLAVHRRGIARFLETGPGKALTGMVKRTLAGVEAATLRAPESEPLGA